MSTSVAFWRHVWPVFLAAAVADARTLRFRAVAVEQAPAIPPRERADTPCAVWLQEHAGQQLSAAEIASQAPCPCLNTPPPLMTPEQTQAVEVQAAADNAMLKGLTRIQEAAVQAAQPLEEELKAMDVKEVEKAAQESLAAAEKNQTEGLKLALEAEKVRQNKEMMDIEAGATMQAKLGADQVRETAEQWAENQARNFIFHAAKGPFQQMIDQADQANTIRQEATELTKGAIKSAANSLEVAKKAQAAIAMVPQESMDNAKKAAQESKEEQKALNVEIEAFEGSVRQIAEVAQVGYQSALRTLDEANIAEVTARKALETSRSNALKIEKLKTRAQAVSSKAKKAQEELEKSAQ